MAKSHSKYIHYQESSKFLVQGNLYPLVVNAAAQVLAKVGLIIVRFIVVGLVASYSWSCT